jgi:CheY-like chemotaxis protein
VPAAEQPAPAVDDDREEIGPRDRVLLIVEDDAGFAAFVRDLARAKGFKSLHASRGTDGLALAHEYRPDAMVLDLNLPDIDGWSVLESLKNNPATRHIPVQVISAIDDEARGLSQGALAFLPKPVDKEALDAALNGVKAFIDRRVKSLLVVEDDPVQRQSIVDLIGNGDVQTMTVSTGREGLAALQQQHFDCVVLDLGLPDISGFQFLDEVKRAGLRNLPIIVYTAKELPKAEETELKRMAQTIVLKDVRSPERLLDETALFLHRVADKLPEPKRRMLQKLRESDEVLADKRVLVVEDDIRNIFAITSLLERHGMDVISAETGRDALEVLQRTPEIDLVLMDIMMPGMDGYETMRAIRANWSRSMPIIALTAKAMKGDREKCLEAGASDYIAKPIDSDRLLSLLRVWLYR